MLKLLTLVKAANTGRLEEFIAQEEARGISADDIHVLDTVIALVIEEARERKALQAELLS